MKSYPVIAEDKEGKLAGKIMMIVKAFTNNPVTVAEATSRRRDITSFSVYHQISEDCETEIESFQTAAGRRLYVMNVEESIYTTDYFASG